MLIAERLRLLDVRARLSDGQRPFLFDQFAEVDTF